MEECCENCLFARLHYNKENGKWKIFCAKHDEYTEKDNLCLSWINKD